MTVDLGQVAYEAYYQDVVDSVFPWDRQHDDVMREWRRSARAVEKKVLADVRGGNGEKEADRLLWVYLQAKVDDLEALLQGARGKVKALEEENETLDKERDVLESRVDTLEMSVQDAHAQVALAQARMNSLQKANDVLRDVMSAKDFAEVKVKELQEENDGLRQYIDDLAGKVARLENGHEDAYGPREGWVVLYYDKRYPTDPGLKWDVCPEVYAVEDQALLRLGRMVAAGIADQGKVVRVAMEQRGGG